MAGYASPSDQLWKFAAQLFEEEAKSDHFAQQAEHGQRIQTKRNQLVSNLSCLSDIIARMYQEEKLSLEELQLIKQMQSSPIQANEELLSIIARKPRDVYECFLSLIKDTNQLHLYQILESVDDTYDEATIIEEHKDMIRRNFTCFSEKLDTDNGLISLLYQRKVLTLCEKEDIFCMNNTYQKNVSLLLLLSRKSPEEFGKFLQALDASGQGHLTNKIRKPEDSPADSEKVSSAIPVPVRIICHRLRPKALDESKQKPFPVRSFSKPFLPPKPLPESKEQLIPSHFLSKPVPPPKPGTLSISAQHYAKSMHTVERPTEKTVNFLRTDDVKFQERLKGLESRLQTDIAIKKVPHDVLFCLDKPEDSLKMCLQTLLQECHQMRKDIVTRNVETNVELERLRKTARQSSVAATLNESLRTQLQSVQKELTSERLQGKKERMQLEENINKLKSDIDNEKMKCKRFEDEKILNNTVIMEMKDSLNRAECDKQSCQQKMHELEARLASTEDELQNTRVNIKESDTEMMLFRTEREQLRESRERLRKENELGNAVDVQLLYTEKNNLGHHPRLTEKERSVELERCLELAEENTLEMSNPQKDAVGEKSLKNDQILALKEELESERHRRKELEDQFRSATEQLEQLTRKPEGRNVTFITQESLVIRTNHQFLMEKIKSSRLVDLLHEKNCITDEERDHLKKQPFGFYRNDALLHWMRTIPFKEDKGQKVLDCFRQAEENFIVDLLEKGGVLIKSKISTNLVKDGLFAKSSTKNVKELKEKEAMVIEKLNQQQGVSLYSIQSATSEMPDNDIVIVPFCHQEANGIVFWFWCQSINGERNLKRMYKSEILLVKLMRIFTEFSVDSVSSASKFLVPTSITIFVGDFTKDENGPAEKYRSDPDSKRNHLFAINQSNVLPEKYKSDPVLTAKFRTKASVETNISINGLTILDKELFVVNLRSSEVEVYDSIKLSFSRRLNFKELINPKDIASCNRNKCLYIFDYRAAGPSNEILKVDASGQLLKNWSTGDDDGRGLSVTDESNVILSVYNKNKLNEYSSDGQLIRQINLLSGIRHPWHAIKLTNGHFVVSHGSDDHDDQHRVCIVDTDGTLMRSFGGKPGSSIGLMNRPVHLSVDGNGFILVVDQWNRRVFLLDSNLKFKREILSEEKHGLRRPSRILLDERRGRMLVVEWGFAGLIKIFQF